MLFRRPLLDLVFPMACLLCGARSSSVCQNCEVILDISSREVTRFDLEGVSCATYSTPVAQLISNYKSLGYLTLAQGFAKAMALAVNDIWEVSKLRDESTILVPVPDHPDSKRSFSPTTLMVRELSMQLGLNWLPGLTMKANVADQAGLSLKARKLNLVNSMSSQAWMSGRAVLLVDDLTTTGATLREARRALLETHCNVRGFVTFAETLKKTSSQK